MVHEQVVYDAWNRMVQIAGTTTATYFYDGLNRRVKTAIGLNTPQIHYFNNNWQCVEEFDDGGGSTARYFPGIRYIDDLIMYRKASVDYLPLPDPNWNATAVVNISSTVLERYTYSAFGKTNYFDASFATRSSTTVGITRTFTGQVIDHETGLMLYRNRHYHPTLGRFLQRDPIGYAGDDVNLYRYCSNAPVELSDPTGEEVTLAAVGAACAVVTVILAGITLYYIVCPPPAPCADGAVDNRAIEEPCVVECIKYKRENGKIIGVKSYTRSGKKVYQSQARCCKRRWIPFGEKSLISPCDATCDSGDNRYDRNKY